MTYLNTSDVLDYCLSLIQDNSTPLRAKLLIWLNKIFQEMALERDWECLKTTATITIGENTILKPSDYHSFVSMKSNTSGSEFFLTERHRLTDEEIFRFTDPNAINPVPCGFEETTAGIVLYPGGSGDVELKYSKEVGRYADASTDTVWPLRFSNVIERKIMSLYYEYDMDERANLSFQLDAREISTLKKWDNRFKPITTRSKYNRDHK